jgi:SNF2-related domain/SNF2 Helicase protein/Helicase conserved C-terminal domain
MTSPTVPGTLQATFWPGDPVPSRGHLALWGTDDLVGEMTRLGFPSGMPATLPTVLPRSPRAYKRIHVADVPTRLVPVGAAVAALAALPSPGAPANRWPGRQRPSDAVLAWSVAAKVALELVAAGRVVPTLRAAGDVGVASWALAGRGDDRLAALAARLPPAAHALRVDGEHAVWSPAAMVAEFGDAVADAFVRDTATHRTPARHRRVARWPHAWLAGLTDPVDPVVGGLDGDATLRAEQLTRWSAVVRIHQDAHARLCLRLLMPPLEVPADERSWHVDYLLQAADDPSLIVDADLVWDAADARVDLGGLRVGDAHEALIRGLAEAVRLFEPLHPSLTLSRPTGIDLDTADAADLLDAAGDLVAAGLGVLLPSELTSRGQRRLRARLRVGAAPPTPGAGLSGAGLDAETLGAFRWEVALGDDALDAAEFAEIVALKQPLVSWRGRWVRVDPDEALQLADLAGTTGRLAPGEALAVALAGERDDPHLGRVAAVADGTLGDLLTRLREGAAGGAADLTGIVADLRDYQHRGVAWLQAMADLGLGTVLADDMGLGKTLQSIALLAARADDRPHLVVCPTSVVGNWERELARFAPDLPVLRHHGPDRATEPQEFEAGAVAVTSYGLVRRDIDLLSAVDWDTVVLDEAQQVKNHASQAARAVRRLPARARVALTGTPVENRLAELWAIVDFADPGLLGPFARFRERYAVPVERWGDTDAAGRLRRIVAPFLLRRTKTEVATDLPPKQDATVVCSLTREQATLYQAAVDRVFDAGLADEGMDRRGQILALLTALKQICNHPAQYLGERGPLPGRSGKLARTAEMLVEVAAAGDRALVFTQYRAMGTLLAHHLAERLDVAEIPFLHGGVGATARDAMVAAFQSGEEPSPVLLVSIKAGGTGLNLTAATHVVHYDRWWNPAVEDQATDRTHRIGQTRPVTVHKLVTAGTVEERVADLLERKRALADAVVGTGETWITELDDEALHDLVSLSAADISDADEAA